MQEDDLASTVAKLSKAYDVAAAQLGNEQGCTVQLATELREAKSRLQARRPLGIPLPSAQSRLQGIEASIIKAHEEYEQIEK